MCGGHHYNTTLKKMAKSCSACVSVKSTPIQCSLHPWEWPTKAWSRIHVDFAGPIFNKSYLVVVDSYSKWPEVFEMTSTTTSKTISVLQHLFSRYGYPDQLVSDNGPQFASNEFEQFMKGAGVFHYRSAPYHPATNGLVERFNRTLKQAIKTGKEAGKPIQESISDFLLVYRATPHATTEVTPSELFLGRVITTRLDRLKPSLKKIVERKQWKQKNIHDRRSREPSYYQGDKVWVRQYTPSYPKWVRGRIVRQLGSRMYLAVLDDGLKVRRHADQLQLDEGSKQSPDTDYNLQGSEWLDVEDESEVEDNPTPGTSCPTVASSPMSVVPTRRYPLRTRKRVSRPGYITY